MKFGITLKPDHRFDRSVALATRAEANGFRYGWLFDSHVLWRDPYPLLTLMGTATTDMRLGTCVTNPATRDVTVTASVLATLNEVTGGRMDLGIGRGDSARRVMGKKPTTVAYMEECCRIVRALTAGEAVTLDGTEIQMTWAQHGPVPIWIAGYGPMALAAAGRVADGVVLHTFLSDETLARSVGIVRRAAEEAGRDPASVRVWAVLATVEESIGEEARLRKLVGRLATYLQGYGEVLVRANGWDLEALQRFRDDPLVQGYPGAFDAIGTTEELTHLRDNVLPAEWLAASATGAAAQCAQRALDQLDAGADSVILHGATPTELAPVLDAWREIRPAGRFDHLPANPGRFS